MKKIIFLTLILFVFSCNPLYKQYKKMNNDVYKGQLYYTQLETIKSLLKHEKKPVILIISWDKNMLTNENVSFTALLYNVVTKEKKTFKNFKENPNKIIISNDISDRSFKEFVYILENYNNGNEKYLLSLKNSFSSSEMNFPYYLYDFKKNKEIEINAIIFDENGKLIQ